MARDATAFLPGARRDQAEAELEPWGLSCEELIGQSVRVDGLLHFSSGVNCIENIVSRLTPIGIGQATARLAAVHRRVADLRRQSPQ